MKLPFIHSKKAVALNPRTLFMPKNLASAYNRLGKEGDAVELLQGFDKAHPQHNSIHIHLLLAGLYSKRADWENVVSSCKKPLC